MTLGRVLPFVAALLVLAPLHSAAQQQISFTFRQLNLEAPSAAALQPRVTDIRADATNRIWVTSTNGVTAFLGTAEAPFFPLNAISDGLLDNEVAAVEFGTVGDQENFFLGYRDGGIQFGRVAGDIGVQFAAGSPLVSTRGASASVSSRNVIRELRNVGGTLYAATQGGLAQWRLGGDAPEEQDPFFEGVPLTNIAGLVSGQTTLIVTASGSTLLVLLDETEFSNVPVPSATNLGTIVDLAFDDRGDLWVLGRDDIVRYDGGSLLAAPDSAEFLQHSFPQSTGCLGSGDELLSLAIDPFLDTVWVGSEAGAFSQIPSTEAGQLFAAGSVCAEDAGTPGWTRFIPSAFEGVVDKVFVDAAGNNWFGTGNSRDARTRASVFALLNRFLTLDSSRYIGFGDIAEITVFDFELVGDGVLEILPTETRILAVDGTEISAEETDDTGRFAKRLTFSETAGPDVIQVSSSADDVPFTVTYTFPDANGDPRTLTAAASWANVVPFEDDLWIGGPCFLNAVRE